MQELMEPVLRQVKVGVPEIPDADSVVVRRRSDLADYFHDGEACTKLIAESNPELYIVHEMAPPEAAGEMKFGISTIYPGTVGDEYFMTKGHFHEEMGTAEIYYCVAGTGYLLMAAEDGQTREFLLSPGDVAYSPPGWAHRTVNSGPDNFVCFYACPANAGHVYSALEHSVFSCRVLCRDGKPVLVRQ